MLLLNEYLRSRFGCKVYKLSLSADVTCPNRDGQRLYFLFRRRIRRLCRGQT